MLGSLTRSRPQLVFRVPCRAPLSIPHSRHVSDGGPAKVRRRSRASYWKDHPRLAYTDKYPLSRELAELGPRGDPLQSTNTTARLRTQIVSPELCDDVLKYIGPSLEKYRGCDIIDLHPGACLWSQKLHEFLQPRTHVLFEPAPDMWSTYQRPLLDKPGSKYRLFQGNMKDKETFGELFDSILPHQKPVEPPSSGAPKPNENLLVTGSIMWDPNASGMGFDSLGKQLLYLFAECSWKNARFHKYGPVRSLLWMTEGDFRGAVPRSHYMYSKFSFVMNYLAKTVQVVTPDHVPKGPAHSTIGRLPQYEIQSVIRAMQRGQENGIELPQHRRDCVHEIAEEVVQRNIEQGKAADARLSQPEIMEYFEKRLREGKTSVGVDYGRDIDIITQDQYLDEHPELRWTTDQAGNPKRTPQGVKLNFRYAQLRSLRKFRIQAEEIADEFEAMFDRECEVLAMEDGPEKEEAKKWLEAKDEELQAALEHIHSPKRTAVVSSANDRITLKSPVPRLQWDTRPYEPLVMQPDEFWPKQRACLIDMEPYPGKDFRLEWFLDFAYALFQSANNSVTKALDSMQSGASSLCDEVPSLRDPARGGRLNLDHMKVNMLTNEMIEDLFLAYNAWPFKDSSANHSKYFQLKQRGHTAKDVISR
ncbi:S-adenosyl-L-methionine-dependent methyltransferase [Karstenula rhodostoma CBS 690.94]|uniref:Mitochondrial transcription factor 1 n=1 Tax=Karstenula rhodostoma CBS 690.94 TaxID=1392251 RepID=A0A9P4PK51_9PLEO|nr:S-adenosyl-L-methionine-dependent methyltransferase [Karstenula rhodostoma CBS 690.94]